ncbi:J domain-containing protein [Marinobacter sp. CA1]|uniref:J domain-containing protein n=1 Tax=Marinobacter sp. CA1 TaxID=2817656 RepID=UPI001D08806C|nr:J domain-containing protein [Marinobacter sp. CA1]UDL06929.1 J domain-containing protein [Marinobacter sp. CA1]
MNCWDVLGIEPTRDPGQIQAAYSQQAKFASRQDMESLEQARRDALAQAGVAPDTMQASEQSDQSAPGAATDNTRPVPETTPSGMSEGLSASDHQVVREVVIQIKALLNDSGRSQDAAIWKAVLAEPPADRQALRDEIARQLESQLRPMAGQGGLALPVAEFLGRWFGWSELEELRNPAEPEPGMTDNPAYARPEDAEAGESSGGQPTTSFWPAVIGWVVGLVVLTSLFSQLTGS